MRKIKKIEFAGNHLMIVIFENGIIKKVDFQPFLDKEVFAPLINIGNFNKAKNKGFFIEWEDFGIDISADTLWHSGKQLASNELVNS